MMIPFLLAVTLGTINLHRTMQRFDEIADEYEVEALPMVKLQNEITSIEAHAWNWVMLNHADALERYRLGVPAIEKAFAELYPEIDEVEAQAVTKGRLAWERAKMIFSGVVADMPISFDESIARMTVYGEQLRVSVDAIKVAETRAIAEGEAALEKSWKLREQTMWGIALLSILAIAGAFAARRRVSRAILDPIGKLSEAARRLGDGDLSHRVILDRTDELGDLGKAFNAMAARLDESRRQLAHQAFHDSLTALANRALLLDRTTHALDRMQRRGAATALLVADLDEFKTINDSLGHAAGDQMLREVARRIEQTIRAGDTAARLGGDEFAVLLEDLTTSDDAYEVAYRVNEALREPAVIDGREVSVKASIGVVIASPDDRADDLLRNADLAMYESKQAGKDRTTIFEPQMHDAMVERLVLEAELRRAVERNELVVHYQPTIELDSGAVVGVEALVRWNHPVRGMLYPGSFIGLAEETGIIIPLGWQVLEDACACRPRRGSGSGATRSSSSA